MNDEAMEACALSIWQGNPAQCRWCNTQLEGRRTRWCSDECAHDMIRNHWWGTARKAALTRDNYKCVRCGTNELGRQPNGETLPPADRGLEVHHRDERAQARYNKSDCCHHLEGIETLCRPCHRRAHGNRRLPRTPKLRPARNPSRSPTLGVEQLAALVAINAAEEIEPSMRKWLEWRSLIRLDDGGRLKVTPLGWKCLLNGRRRGVEEAIW